MGSMSYLQLCVFVCARKGFVCHIRCEDGTHTRANLNVCRVFVCERGREDRGLPLAYPSSLVVRHINLFLLTMLAGTAFVCVCVCAPLYVRVWRKVKRG